MKHRKIIMGSILISFFALIVLLVFVLRGNFFRYNDINSMIVEPDSSNLLITGTWKIKSVRFLNSDDSVEFSAENDKLYITNKAVSFLDSSTKSAKFKFRYVNFKNYLLSKGIVSDKIKSDSENVIVVSISDKFSYFQEFIVLNDSTLGMIFDKKYYIFERESKNVNVEIKQSQKEENKTSKSDTTFLIGLRSVDKKDISYETFLIRKNTENKVSINKIDGLFINNKNKFFLVNSNTNNSIYLTEDYISLTNRKVLQTNNPIINFLSENYISLETRDNENSKKNYEIHLIKNLQDNSKLSINDISGNSGENSYFESIRKMGYSSEYITTSDMYNFGIKRENEKWVFKSIFNDNFSNGKFATTEVNLDLIPTVDIFENLSNKISKSVVKNKNSNFVDYFVSPNENMLVILTPEELVVYSINDSVVETLPLATVNIFDKKEIVSFQWKTSESSEFTFNEFIKIKQLDIKKNM